MSMMQPALNARTWMPPVHQAATTADSRNLTIRSEFYELCTALKASEAHWMLPVFIEPDWIMDVDVQTRDELLELMVGRLASTIKGVPMGRLLQAILLREKQCPTVVSAQLAVPHAKMSGLSAFYAALARCRKGVEFAPGKRVKMVCLLLGPDKAQKQYLELLASILRLFQNKGQKLANADVAQLHRMLVSAAQAKR